MTSRFAVDLIRINTLDRFSFKTGAMSDKADNTGRVEGLLRTQSLTKIYHMGDVEVRALNSVDFAANEGEFIVILGPSGSGKSTFLNLVGGLDTATSGEVWFQDHQLTGASEGALTRYRRDHVGFIFQFYNLVPSLTAKENVQLVTEISRNPMRPEEALEMAASRTA
jgi:putative ABC transport system ATP-binding protein